MHAIWDQMWLGVQAVARMVRHPRAQALALAVGLYIAIGVVFYSWQEGWSLADSFYFTVVALTTVGLGDLAPTTTFARIFTAAYLAIGLGILVTAVHSVIQNATSRLAPTTVESTARSSAGVRRTAMRKIPGDDPRAAYRASDAPVDHRGLAEFVRDRHQWVLATTRRDGRPQMSLVTGGMTPAGGLLVASYPERAKARNAGRNPAVSVLVTGAEFSDAWVQIDGTAEVLDMPEAGDGLVEYYRSISGEHPDWDEYRQAMADQGKCLIAIEPSRWGPVSKGGFPPSLFED